MNNQHGGKRIGAGRKANGKKTVVLRIDAELLPAIEHIKQHGFDYYYNNQETINQLQSEKAKLLEVNALRVQERDAARMEVFKLKSEVSRLESFKAERKELKNQLSKQKQVTCQCMTAKSIQCTKQATHELKRHGFIVWVCEQHYKTLQSELD